MSAKVLASIFVFSLLPGFADAATESVRSGGGSNSSAGSSSNSSGGRCNIKPAEKSCGSSKDFGTKLAKTAYDNANGERSGGKCLKGVRESFQEACGLKESPSWGVNAAEDSGSCFKQSGLTEHAANDPVPYPPKPGTVFVYEGGEFGHVEIYTGNQMEGKATYCSDYCSNKRRDIQSAGTRKLAHWYEPPETTNDSTPMAAMPSSSPTAAAFAISVFAPYMQTAMLN